MSVIAKTTTATIIPTLRYRDAPAAIEFLCIAFGFEKLMVVPGENGTIAHSQLTYRNGMIMVGSAREDEFGKPPCDIGGVVTQSVYIIVDDVDAHCRRSMDAGADIFMEPADQEHGGRLYSCRDPEGHLWNFGSYDPWQSENS